MRKKEKFLAGWNLLLLVFCIALFLILATFLIWDYQMQSAETERLKEIVDNEQEMYVPEVEKTEPTEELAEFPEEEEIPAATGIACWGDEFFRGADAEQYSYRAILQAQLTENGYEMEVTNKTLSGASTLSMMKMAGVSEEEIEAYIAVHQEAANGETLAVTETGTRNLTEEQTARTEVDDIPVIFMGYYGGWNHDLQELIEQQKKILDTFGQNKERFLIAGVRPMDGRVTGDAYDSAMVEAWGEHYISMADVTTESITSRAGQEAAGKAIYEKLVDLEYIEKVQE